MTNQATTILKPSNTKIQFDAIIQSNNIRKEPTRFKSDLEICGGTGAKGNRFIYSFDFIPATFEDYYRLEQLVEHIILSQTPDEYRSLGGNNFSDGINITDWAERHHHDNSRYCRCSQLFQPKLNIDESEDLKNKYAHINGHLRNDPTGVIYLQIDYIDVFEIPTMVELDQDSASVDLEDDW